MIPIKGDLVLEGLGMDPEVRQVLIQDLEVIINSAASINFDDPIREALKINYFGAQRILELAHECKNLLCVHHVSTAFVTCNFDMHSTASEDIHPLQGIEDAEKFVADLMKMEPQVLEREEPILLKKFGFPNTYTFTKRLSEISLYKNKGNLRLTISRPAVVTCCDVFPFPGWTDSGAAAGAVIACLGYAITHR